MQHQNHHKYLSDAHREKWINNFKMVQLKPIKVLKQFNDWRDDVIIWFNNWVTSPYQYKRKQLYLWGPASTGKSTFIQRVLFAQYGGQVFKANSSDKKYCWENFNQKTHNLVTIDEFEYKDHDINILKLALAGEDFICPVKFKDAQLKFVQCPIVIISNHPPPVFNEPFMERVQVIDTEPKEDQQYGAYEDFFEFMDLWLYQKQMYNYETDATESMKQMASIFNSNEYREKEKKSNATLITNNTIINNESTIVAAKRKAHEAFNDNDFNETTPTQKKRTFTFKKASQQTPPPSNNISNPITSTPATTQLLSTTISSDDDDDFRMFTKRTNTNNTNVHASAIKKTTKTISNEEMAKIIDETLDYILN